MSQAEPLKATFNRDEMEKRINEALEKEEGINREFTTKPSSHDLIYDELRNIYGFLQDRLGQDGVLDSIDERLCEGNDLLWRVVNKDSHRWDEPEEGEEIMKKVKLAKDERHIIYQALGSRVSTMRNQMGYSKYHSKTTAEEVERDTGLEEEIDKHKKLIYKLKKS